MAVVPETPIGRNSELSLGRLQPLPLRAPVRTLLPVPVVPQLVPFVPAAGMVVASQPAACERSEPQPTALVPATGRVSPKTTVREPVEPRPTTLVPAAGMVVVLERVELET